MIKTLSCKAEIAVDLAFIDLVGEADCQLILTISSEKHQAGDSPVSRSSMVHFPGKTGREPIGERIDPVDFRDGGIAGKSIGVDGEGRTVAPRKREGDYRFSLAFIYPYFQKIISCPIEIWTYLLPFNCIGR
jgi:hypothetical protein